MSGRILGNNEVFKGVFGELLRVMGGGGVGGGGFGGFIGGAAKTGGGRGGVRVFL